MEKFRKWIALSVLIACFGAVAAAWRDPGANHKVGRTAGGDRIAIIRVEGVLSGGASAEGWENGAVGAETLAQQLNEARRDPHVKAVLLRINSPGGSVSAAEETAREIARYKESGKPIVASMGDMAASAGYWLAASCDKIYANPSTLTGSIGVYVPYLNLEGLYDKLGVRQEKIKSGIHKDILSPERPMTPQEREILQTMVSEMYDTFVDVVSTGRHLSPEAVRKLADGRIYTGRQAKTLGLVDELGNFQDAIIATGVLAGLGETPEVREMGADFSWRRLFKAESLLQLMSRQMLDGSPALNAPALPQ